jgi:hypothetical protein
MKVTLSQISNDGPCYEWYASSGILILNEDYLILITEHQCSMISNDRGDQWIGITGENQDSRRLILTVVHILDTAYHVPLFWVTGKRQEESKILLATDKRGARDFMFRSIMEGHICTLAH